MTTNTDAYAYDTADEFGHLYRDESEMCVRCGKTKTEIYCGAMDTVMCVKPDDREEAKK